MREHFPKDSLLPCPFCAEPAKVGGDERDGFYVYCTSRDCYAAVGENYDGCAMPSHWCSSEEQAAAAWNKRTSR